MQENSVGKLLLVLTLLLFFAAIGIGHIVKPDGFIKRSAFRRGGEMLTEWNRLQFQIFGAVFAGTAGWIIYEVLTDYFSH